MHKQLFLFLVFIFVSCNHGLQIPESTEDPNDPNHGPILQSVGELDYPYEGRANLEGVVEVEFTIDILGNVKDVKILRRKFNADAILTTSGETVYIKDIVDDSVINFYKQCKYIPAHENGQPIELNVRTSMNYVLRK